MSDEAPAAAETSDTLFHALRVLHAEGRIALDYDFARLRHMDSPVALEADANSWAYAVVAAALLALWRGGWWAALAVGAAGTALYYSLGRRQVQNRIRRRIAERALVDLALWQRLWRFGGIVLRPQGGEPCVAPHGNWMALVRRLREPA